MHSGLSASGVLSISETGDISSVVAGSGLTGGGTTGDVTLNVQVDDSSIEIDSDTLQVKASGITNAMLGGSIANSKLANSSITVTDGSNSTATALGGTITFEWPEKESMLQKVQAQSHIRRRCNYIKQRCCII